ncbi:hypothetical protein SAMN05421638_2174 [Kaistella treverensis]|uniref:Uncharacterized protein n=1 Tax=Kaistella treverensis TaxID=631455 RepID=A0A1I3NM26_9FLAO|nr:MULTISPECIES: hypothetical protein [Kaistella]SFJ10398.1 hypothetical protein SAMN05421638_2174 [Kaistella treverensis]
MKLADVKQILPTLENVEFQLENGTFVPEQKKNLVELKANQNSCAPNSGCC